MIAKVFVNSPLQVISAWEFQRFLPETLAREVADFDLIVVNAGSVRSVSQTCDTAARLGFAYRILGRRGHNPNRVRERFTLVRREVQALGAEDLVAVGDPSFDLYRDGLARSASDEAWALDDGVGNWRYLQAVVAGKTLPGTFEVGAFRKLAKRVLVGPTRTPDWGGVNWYSIFTRYVPDHDRTYQNSLSRLKGRSKFTALDDSVLFLGSPLVSVGILSESDYATLCRIAAERLERRYPGARLIYVQHRAEGAGEHGADFFETSDVSRGPIELRWLNGARPPRAVAGVFSTALFTLGELLRDTSDVVSLWPASGFELRARREQLAQLLSLFEASHADRCVDLEMVRR